MDINGNISMKIKLNFKYGPDGFKVKCITENGLTEDIVISKDSKKIFEFLGFDYERYLKGFDTLEEIFDWVINSKYFNYEKFLMDNLNHIDRKRNKKRATYQKFLEYINTKDLNSLPKHEFNKEKETYIDIIDNYFPEVKLVEKLAELTTKDAYNKLIAERFNGNLIMEWTGLKGKELGECIVNFKKYIEVQGELPFKHWVLQVDNIKEEFLAWLKEG